jgi:succinyl-diaminopimelate desuccinylase
MHALARFVTAITAAPVDSGNVHFPPTTFQMVNVHCDAGAPNVVPGELKCRFNFRYSTEWTHETLAAHVQAILEQLGLDYEITWRVAGKPFLCEDEVLADAVSRAIEEVTGITTVRSTSGGTSDGRFIAPYGVNVVEVGPINSTIHKIDEEILVADIPRLQAIYLRIAEILLIESNAS